MKKKKKKHNMNFSVRNLVSLFSMFSPWVSEKRNKSTIEPRGWSKILHYLFGCIWFIPHSTSPFVTSHTIYEKRKSPNHMIYIYLSLSLSIYIYISYGGVCGVVLSSWKIETVTWGQMLNVTVCISHSNNTIGKYINPIVVFSAKGKY